MPLSDIKYIIEALRTSPTRDKIVRAPGRLPIRYGGRDPVAQAGKDVGYTKYVRQQEAMGESPVSLEEWLRQ